jgi:hypothetical protein
MPEDPLSTGIFGQFGCEMGGLDRALGMAARDVERRP